MGYLLPLILAFATLYLPEIPGVGDASVTHTGRSALRYLPLLAAVPYALSYLIRVFERRGRLTAAGTTEKLMVFAPVLLQAASVLALGWLEALERWGTWLQGSAESSPALELHGPPDAALIFGILPFVLFEVLTIDARARLHGSLPGIRPEFVRRARTLQLRLFLSSFLPFLPIALLSTLIGWNETWSVRLEEVGLLGAGFSVAILVGAALFLPRLIMLAWDTSPMEAGELRTRLEELAKRRGFRFKGLCVWHTGGLMSNAVIVGFTAASRTVLFTDALLKKMRPAEIEAVFAHEMGHAHRHHGLAMAASFLVVVFGCEFLAESLAPWLGENSSSIELGIPVLGIGIWALVFGRVSRAMELEADLESYRTIGDVQPLASTLFKITEPAAYRRSSWRHPSTARRIAFLLDVERDPGLGRKLQKRLAYFGRIVFVGLALGLAWQFNADRKTWGVDWIVSDLRLGDYGSAGARLAASTDVPEQLQQLVQLSVTLNMDAAEPEALEHAALQAAEEGEWERASNLVQLAYLRGSAGAGSLLEVFDALRAGEPLPEVELPDGWQRILDARVDDERADT